MAAQMRGPDAGGSGGGGGGGRPGINRRVSSVFELGGGSGGGRANPGISSPPRRQSTRPSLSTAASFSVGSSGGPGGLQARLLPSMALLGVILCVLGLVCDLFCLIPCCLSSSRVCLLSFLLFANLFSSSSSFFSLFSFFLFCDLFSV